MQRIAPHLRLASRAIISNIWLLEDGQGGRFLLDTGHVLERPWLRHQLAHAGIRGRGELTAVLLTHRHSDHAGNAAWLRRTFDCPVVCHAADAEYLSGARPAPRLARGTALPHHELLCHIEDRLPARSVVDDVFEEGAWRWGFEIIPVPGHTEGSVMLYHAPTQTLFSGDAILSGYAPLRLFERLNLAVDGFSLDVDRCHGSVQRFLSELPPVDVLCAGHGPAVTKDARRKLQALAARAARSARRPPR